MTAAYTLSPSRCCLRNQTRVQLAFLPALSVVERNRLAGLAQSLCGVSTAEPTGYLLTPGRARKCALLFEGGFRHDPTERGHVYVGPSGRRLRRDAALAEAIRNKNTTAIQAA